MTFNTPTLLWSQTPESIDISIRLSNIESESVSCENNHFYFSCSSQSKDYWIEFDLDKAVEKVSYNKYDNRIAIVLEKADYEKWDFLTKVRGIYKNNIKIDWDKWADSDADEEVENQPQDLSSGENQGSPLAPSSGGNLGSPLAPSSGFGGMDMNMMRQMMGGMDMNMMQQMMGGMNMGGEDGKEEGEEEGDEGEEEGEEEGDEGEEEGDEGEGEEEEDGEDGEDSEEGECDEGEEGEGHDGEDGEFAQ